VASSPTYEDRIYELHIFQGMAPSVQIARLKLPAVSGTGEPGAGEEIGSLPTESCFLVDVEALRGALADFREAFPRCDIFYALKANSDPLVVATLADLGCGFEAASWGEIALLAGLGVGPQQIIYGTAVKPPAEVARAFSYGVDRYAADSREELVMLSATAPGSRVFLRVTADDSGSVYHLNRKFGAALRDAAPLLLLARELGLVPWGLSFNVGSQASRKTAWAESLAALSPSMESLQEHDIKLGIINIGGGFPEAYAGDHPWSLCEIAAPLFQAHARLPYQPGLVIEPGRRLVARSTALIATVFARIERENGPWLFLDCGVYNGLFEALRCQGDTKYEVSRIGSSSAPLLCFALAGPTGDSLDVLSEGSELPADTGVGDQLRFECAGAYTLALASSFNGFAPPPVRMTGRG